MKIPSDNNKRIVKNTLMLYFRMMLTMLVTLYTSRVVLNVLGVEDFGIYNVVGGVATMFSFLNAAMASGTQRFLSYELGRNDLDQYKMTFGATLTIHIALALTIFLVAQTIGVWFLNNHLNIPLERMEAAQWVFQFAVLSALISVIQIPYNASIIAHEEMGVYAYVSIFEVSLKLAMVILLSWIGFDKLKLYAMLMFSVTFVIAVFYKSYCKRKFSECNYSFLWDKSLYYELVSYGGWNLFGNLAVVGFTQGINILLNIFFGPAVNAARAIASQVGHAIRLFVTNFQLAVNPQIVKYYASNEKERMINLVFQSSRYSFFLLLIISLPVYMEADSILRLWLKIVPDYTVIFCRLIITNSLIDCVSGSLMIAAQATGVIKKYQAVVGSVLLLNLPASYIFLYKGFPPEITAYVSITLSIFALIFRLHILRGLINLSVRQFLRSVVAISVVVTLLASLLPFVVVSLLPVSLIRLILTTVVSLSCSLLAIYFCALGQAEKQFASQKTRALFLRLRRKFYDQD